MSDTIDVEVTSTENTPEEEKFSFPALDNLLHGSEDKFKVNGNLPAETDDKPKRGRPKKTMTVKSESEMVRDAKTPLNSNMPYITTYTVPTQILTQAAMDIDNLASAIKQDLEAVRKAKAMKNKYTYITDLNSSLGMLYSNKISIARELANTITNSHRLELNKHKELSATQPDENDDKRVMDMFNAFINAPMGSIPQNSFKAIPPEIINSIEANGVPIASDGANIGVADDSGYQDYLNNMTPAQQSMLNSVNPNIETVVVYDQTSHNKWFEVMDTRTGQTLQNAEVPADFVLAGCVIDIRNGIARNAQLNQTFKLKLVGSRLSDEF